MKISDYITPDLINIHFEAATKEDVFRGLVSLLAAKFGTELEAEEIFRALWERENLHSTAIGDGLAMPHARVKGAKDIIMCLALKPEGVKGYCGPEHKPVKILFLLCSPDKQAIKHLKALAQISKMLHNPEIREKLLNPVSPEEVWDLIKNSGY